MAQQRRDILQEHVQAVLQGARHLGGTHQVGDETLLIHHVLTDNHGVFLHLGDVYQEFLIYVFLVVDLLGVLGDFLGEELDHIGIQVYTLIQDAGEDAETGMVLPRIHLQTALQFREGAQRHLAKRRKGVVHNGEGHGLHHILFRTGRQEVRIGKDGFVRFEVTG